MRNILILARDDEVSPLLKALQLEQERRGNGKEINFSTIGSPTPKLDCIGKGVMPASVVPLQFDEPLLEGGAKIKSPNHDSMPDG